MTIETFIEHTREETQPDAAWPPALQALWHAERGEWDTAHRLCQTGSPEPGAWVHANLHREEGDLSNASYWYSQAGKPVHHGDVETERRDIATALLAELPD